MFNIGVCSHWTRYITAGEDCLSAWTLPNQISESQNASRKSFKFEFILDVYGFWAWGLISATQAEDIYLLGFPRATHNLQFYVSVHLSRLILWWLFMFSISRFSMKNVWNLCFSHFVTAFFKQIFFIIDWLFNYVPITYLFNEIQLIIRFSMANTLL